MHFRRSKARATSSYEIGESTFASQREQTFGPPRPFTSTLLDNVVGSSLRVDLAGAGPQPPVPLNLIHHATLHTSPDLPPSSKFPRGVPQPFAKLARVGSVEGRGFIPAERRAAQRTPFALPLSRNSPVLSSARLPTSTLEIHQSPKPISDCRRPAELSTCSKLYSRQTPTRTPSIRRP